MIKFIYKDGTHLLIYDQFVEILYRRRITVLINDVKENGKKWIKIKRFLSKDKINFIEKHIKLLAFA